jgi:hypothetical protein
MKQRRPRPVRLFGSLKRAERTLERVRTQGGTRISPALQGWPRQSALSAPKRSRWTKSTMRKRVDEAQLERDQAKVEAGFWDKVKKVAKQIPFLDDSARRLLRHA